jgi:hypothetical protein
MFRFYETIKFDSHPSECQLLYMNFKWLQSNLKNRSVTLLIHNDENNTC